MRKQWLFYWQRLFNKSATSRSCGVWSRHSGGGNGDDDVVMSTRVHITHCRTNTIIRSAELCSVYTRSVTLRGGVKPTFRDTSMHNYRTNTIIRSATRRQTTHSLLSPALPTGILKCAISQIWHFSKTVQILFWHFGIFRRYFFKIWHKKKLNLAVTLK